MNLNRSAQLAARARNAVTRFRLRCTDYEATLDLLTEHAHRVRSMHPRAAGGAVAQSTALVDIYRLMEWVQQHDPGFLPLRVYELAEPIGHGCYVTQPTTSDY